MQPPLNKKEQKEQMNPIKALIEIQRKETDMQKPDLFLYKERHRPFLGDVFKNL